MSLPQHWVNKLANLRDQELSGYTGKSWISAAQFIFNPSEENEVAINPNEQVLAANLTLSGEASSTLSVNTCSDAFAILSLASQSNAEGNGIAWSVAPKYSKILSCLIRPYINGKVCLDPSTWVLLPQVKSKSVQTLSLDYANDTTRCYTLLFDVLPDEQNYLAYFGNVVVMPDS